MKKVLFAIVAAVGTLTVFAQTARAYDYTGNVNMLEIWFNGNVAFTLSSSVPTCNSQFVLNVSSAGTKNQYAALLAAKAKGVQVRVYGGDTCGLAEGTSTNYNLVSYLYVLDN